MYSKLSLCFESYHHHRWICRFSIGGQSRDERMGESSLSLSLGVCRVEVFCSFARAGDRPSVVRCAAPTDVTYCTVLYCITPPCGRDYKRSSPPPRIIAWTTYVHTTVYTVHQGALYRLSHTAPDTDRVWFSSQKSSKLQLSLSAQTRIGK